MRRSSWFTGVSVPYFASKIEAFATSRRSPGASVAVLLQHKCDRMCFEMMLTAHKGLGGSVAGAVEQLNARDCPQARGLTWRVAIIVCGCRERKA